MSILGEPIILGNSGGLSSYYTINDDSSDLTVQATQYIFGANPSIITGPHSVETSTGWEFSVSVEFMCNNVWCSGISGSYYSLGGGIPTWGSIYFAGIGGVYSWNDTNGSWADSVYKTIIIPNSQLGDNELVSWLNQNTVSQTATTVSIPTTRRTITPHPSVPVIQNVKMYTISQNGSYSILPDNGVSAFQSASINVNINNEYLSKIIDRTISGTYENSILTTIGSYAFYHCRSLTTASFPNCATIRNNTFYSCYNLLSLYLTSTSIVQLEKSDAFSWTPIAGYTTSTGGVYGSIYVPSSLLSDYQTATNWSYFSSRFVGI